MDEIIREQQFSGRVVGIRASYSPRLDPQTGARLESLWQNGNVDDRSETIYIRARKAIIIGAGGHGANPQFRSMFYPAWREPAFVSSGWALLGPRGQDASGIIAGMRVGANLAGMQQNLSYGSTFHFPEFWPRAIPTPTCFRATRRSRCGDPRASILATIRSST